MTRMRTHFETSEHLDTCHSCGGVIRVVECMACKGTGLRLDGSCGDCGGTGSWRLSVAIPEYGETQPEVAERCWP